VGLGRVRITTVTPITNTQHTPPRIVDASVQSRFNKELLADGILGEKNVTKKSNE